MLRKCHMGNVKILLVEDNIDDVFLTNRALSKLDLRDVSVVSDGREALTFLFGDGAVSPDTPMVSRPDVILLDQRMPILDGLQFMERAHQALMSNGIPVIVITSSTLAHEKERFFELGVRDYIGKPINQEGLSRAIARVLN